MSGYSGQIPDTEPAGQWAKQGVCKTDPDAMFPGNNEDDIAAAKQICGRCPVRQECLDDALRTGDNDYGIRGGLKPGARRAIAKQQAAAPRPARTLQTLWNDRAEPAGDGHTLWSGAVPVSYYGRNLTPYQISFELHRGQPPVGLVRRTCDREGCVEPAHIGDQEDRDRIRAKNAPRPATYSPNGRVLASCGTRSAYQRHVKNGERIDPECRRANTEARARLVDTGTTRELTS